jgi:hypothetical protein
MIVEEGKRKEIEARLRQLIALQNKSQQQNPPTRSTPPGTRVIRRRKDAPDKHII